MTAQTEFQTIYSDLLATLESSAAKMADLKIDNEVARELLEQIIKSVYEIRDDFQQELLFLQENSEWDRFTMAFFGETNAGKSTIIESLRILLSEEQRMDLLAKSNGDLETFKRAIDSETANVELAFSHAQAAQSKRFETLNHQILTLHSTVTRLQSKRLKLLYGVGSFILGFAVASAVQIVWLG